MPAFPMRGTMAKYLESEPCFDAVKTPSLMGLLTELVPPGGGGRAEHSSNALGVRSRPAGPLVDRRHCRDITPFGPNSPFQRMLELSPKIVLFGVTVSSMTLCHVVEDVLAEEFPLRVYRDAMYSVPCVARGGEKILVSTRAMHPELRRFATRTKCEAISSGVEWNKTWRSERGSRSALQSSMHGAWSR